MSCYCDHEWPKFYIEKTVKARKQHTCCECDRTINRGEQYESITGLWDGDIKRYKTCEQCSDLRESLSDVICPGLGNLRDDYSEYLVNEGRGIYDDDADRYIYPDNHMGLNK